MIDVGSQRCSHRWASDSAIVRYRSTDNRDYPRWALSYRPYYASRTPTGPMGVGVEGAGMTP